MATFWWQLLGSSCSFRGDALDGRRTIIVSMVAASIQDVFEFGHYGLREGVEGGNTP